MSSSHRSLAVAALVVAVLAFTAGSPAVQADPVAAPPPLANLQPVTQFPDAPNAAYQDSQFVVDGVLVAQHSDPTTWRGAHTSVATFDPITGARLTAFEHAGEMRAVGNFMIGLADGVIEAVEARSARHHAIQLYDRAELARLRPEHSSLDVIEITAAAALGDAIYLVVVEEHQRGHDVPSSAELIALDVAHGAVRWRHPVDTERYANTQLQAAGTAVVLSTNDVATGYDAANGARLWRRPESLGTLVTDGRTLVVVRPLELARGVWINHWARLDARTGVESHGFGDRKLGGALLADGVLYTVIRDRAGDTLAAFDPNDGTRRWASATFPELDEDWPEVIRASRDGVYTCQGGALRAFDRSTGALQLSWGLDGCEVLGATDDAVVVRHVSLQRQADRALIGFARTAQPAPIAHIAVTGVVTSGCVPLAFEPVRVGDALVLTDPSGHYTATTSTRGTLRVEVAPVVELLVGNRVERERTAVLRDLVTTGTALAVDLAADNACFKHAYVTCELVHNACPHRAP